MTTTATRIDVTDLDPAALLAGLHNNTVSPSTWACNLTAKHRDITVEEAVQRALEKVYSEHGLQPLPDEEDEELSDVELNLSDDDEK